MIVYNGKEGEIKENLSGKRYTKASKEKVIRQPKILLLPISFHLGLKKKGQKKRGKRRHINCGGTGPQAIATTQALPREKGRRSNLWSVILHFLQIQVLKQGEESREI